MTKDASAIPAFARGTKLRWDETRGAWMVLAPERVFVPDDIAVAILRLIDAKRSLGDIALMLARDFTAPPGEILADMTEMLDDLAQKGIVTWQ